MSLISKFSVQLYTVRELTEKDFPGVFKTLGEIGYTGVEFAGYGGVQAAEMKKYLDDNGLESVGSHVPVSRLLENLDEELEYNRVIGTQNIIIPHADIKTRDDALRMAETANTVGEKCVKAGFGFAYHNHAHEFAKDNGEYLLDILFANVIPNICKMELDLYWAAFGGAEPIAYMEKNADKLRLLHIKQIKDYESRKGVDLGDGVIDFKDVISRGKSYGIEHFILEQEEFEVSPYDSLRRGFEHIMSL